jgi:hypothetical protein
MIFLKNNKLFLKYKPKFIFLQRINIGLVLQINQVKYLLFFFYFEKVNNDMFFKYLIDMLKYKGS